MAPLSRAETQERTRARVLAAARAEFAERGFREARIDGIAERARLTRGAVYSNFPGKRALYFTVLADLAERAAVPAAPAAPATVERVLGALARAWLARLPLVSDDRQETRLGLDLIPEILADARTRKPFAQLMKLDAIVLGLALESLRPPGGPGGRMVRLAEAALTTLHGASQMAAAAPGFAEPFDIVAAVERLAGIDLGDRWPPRTMVPPVLAVREAWRPPSADDVLRDRPARLSDDGVVAFLGLHRLSAAEEAVRAAAPGAGVTVVTVTGDPGELAPLARLVLVSLRERLRRAVPARAWPGLQIVVDERGTVAAAAGVHAVSDATETAVRVEAGRIVARAEGTGACHAVASVTG
ncbi:TetR/AcrR family transcriptional regulator [Spongiactinospora sp. TRM90649]|uniref:TetR/AcrR family transcriptional regulator n=1 Tax=Spongiactinospora sp. TRM90649 TaxID=3031114 RepID=UPI0023F770C5|nr:TetR/AcrR family transcriptional regulator [Spongiactinospora sp. TRM90649]MDF5752119.1 TetR/AcrR family transcriptional regulator [Spongiactinospora sp. TRM90649]